MVLDATVTPNATHLCTASNTAGANVTLAPPQYTLWIYDMDKGTLGPVLSADLGTMVVEPVILQPRKPAPRDPGRCGSSARSSRHHGHRGRRTPGYQQCVRCRWR